MRGGVIILGILLFSGCVGRTSHTDPPESTPDARREQGEPESTDPPGQLPVGLAWTYEGDERYNDDHTFTVVVAEASPKGYLFAAGAEDDLVYEALWLSPWLGRRDADTNRVDWYSHVLDLPLFDGKTWAFTDERTVTARAADISTPRGIQPGFIIEGERLRYEYAPMIGNIVLWEWKFLDGTSEHIRMTNVEEAQPWIWFERPEIVVVPNPHEPAAFEIAAGYDALLVSAGGMKGSRAFVQPPNGAAAWSTEFGAEEDWRHAMLAPTEGRWTAAIAGRPYVEAPAEMPDLPVGWGYMHLAPVKWIRSG